MPEPKTILTERTWTVVAVRNFFFAGVWRQVGDQLTVEPNEARSMIEAGNAIAVNWPQQRTDNPYALQNVGPAPSSPGAGVGSVNGLAGDINILAGPNITVTTGATSITVGAPNVVPTSRQVIAGAGLSGGGALTGNITLTANVTSVFGRTGAITAQAGDYNAGQITLSPAVSTWTNVQQAITALAAAPPGMWQSSASPAGSIFYSGGPVGIGSWTAAAGPLVTLDVFGPGASPGITHAAWGPARLVASQGACRLILDTVDSPEYGAVAFYTGGGQSGASPTYLGEIGADSDGMLFYSSSTPGGSTAIWIAPNGHVWIGQQPSSGTPSSASLHVQGSYEGPAALVQATAPANPQPGQLWWDSINIRLMVWNGAWIQT